MDLFSKKINLPIGSFLLVSSIDHLKSISLIKETDPKKSYHSCPILEKAAEQLQEYFAKQRQNFDIPIDFHGSEFQEKVWKAVQEIPYGHTKTYQEIAQIIGNEKASRAVGLALNKNPLPFIIPCHRVILKSGISGGYAFGNKLKQLLLEQESL